MAWPDHYGTSTTLEAGRPRAEVARLRATFETARTHSHAWRRQQLEGISRLVTERESDLSRALASDLGRSAHEAWLGDVASTLGEARYAIRHLKGWMRRRRTLVPLALLPGSARYVYQPLGTVLVIGPWNYPFYLTLAPLIAAVAAGNCVVVKPSEHAPAASALLAELLPQYVDSDTISVIEGGPAVIHELINEGLDHVFFTGGTEAGREIAQSCARHLTRVTLELGGKSPVIVTKRADLAVAARRIAWGKLLNSGQTCVAPDYVLVEAQVRDEFLSVLEKTVEKFRAGQPECQPIVNERQHNRLTSLLRDVTVIYGGRYGDEQTLQPTIVLDPPLDAPVMKSEIFGPILPVLTVDSLDDAIGFVKRGEKPLAAYIFSNSRAEQQRFVAEVPAGGVVANHVAMHVLAPQLPFGGIGASGVGSYHGRWGFETFSHRKASLVMRARPDLKIIYPPYSASRTRILRKIL